MAKLKTRYVCQACGHAFEEFQSMSAKPLRKCPSCKKAKLKRLIGTGAGIIFKGGGFWQTDYRSENYKAGAKADAEASKPAEAKGDGAKADAGTKKDAAPVKSEGAKSEASKSEPAPKKAEAPGKPESKPTRSAKKGK